MNLENQLLFFFSALGVFNGLLLSAYFVLIIKPKRIAHYFLGILILMLCIRIGKSVFYYFDSDLPKIYLQIGLSGCFLIGPALYFYLVATVQKISKVPTSWKIHISLLLLILFTVGGLYPYQSYPDFWNQYFVKVIYLQWIIYVLISGFMLKDIARKIVSRSETLNPLETWLVSIYIGNLGICCAYIAAYFTIYIIGSLFFSIVFYVWAFLLLIRKNREAIFAEPPSKYADKKIDQTEALGLEQKLESIMLEKELYKNPSLKLQDVAKELDIVSHRLSQLLNDNLGKSFSVYVNEYRIEEAKKLIATQDQYTLEAIGYEAGFSSKSTFYSTFKKHTDTTPSTFKKSVN